MEAPKKKEERCQLYKVYESILIFRAYLEDFLPARFVLHLSVICQAGVCACVCVAACSDLITYLKGTSQAERGMCLQFMNFLKKGSV